MQLENDKFYRSKGGKIDVSDHTSLDDVIQGDDKTLSILPGTPGLAWPAIPLLGFFTNIVCHHLKALILGMDLVFP